MAKFENLEKLIDLEEQKEHPHINEDMHKAIESTKEAIKKSFDAVNVRGRLKHHQELDSESNEKSNEPN